VLNVTVLFHECFSFHDLLHCWQAASLLKYKVNHRESLTLAAKHLNYECSEDLIEFVYEKLRPKEKVFT
jgi:chromodomain-helicase-DNA-binding protein 4